jgi:hypothetical protein
MVKIAGRTAERPEEWSSGRSNASELPFPDRGVRSCPYYVVFFTHWKQPEKGLTIYRVFREGGEA